MNFRAVLLPEEEPAPAEEQPGEPAATMAEEPADLAGELSAFEDELDIADELDEMAA